MPEKDNAYYMNLLRRDVQNDQLTDEERRDLEAYSKQMDTGDHEPHRLSRSQTLRILSSPTIMSVLARNR